MKKFKLKSYDEVHNIWFLKRQVFWFVYKWVGTGKKEDLQLWVHKNGGIII